MELENYAEIVKTTSRFSSKMWLWEICGTYRKMRQSENAQYSTERPVLQLMRSAAAWFDCGICIISDNVVMYKHHMLNNCLVLIKGRHIFVYFRHQCNSNFLPVHKETIFPDQCAWASFSSSCGKHRLWSPNIGVINH